MKESLFALLMITGVCSLLKAQIPQDTLQHSPIDTAAIRIEPAEQPSDKTLPVMGSAKNFESPEKHDCLYHYKPAIDIPVTIVGAIGAPLGFYFINKKPATDTNVILNLDPQTDIKLAINRKDIHNYDPHLKQISDYFLYGSFLYGFVLLADHDIRQDAGKIGLLFLETMSITGASYSLTAASVDKLRPYAYNTDSNIVDGVKVPEVPFDVKTSTHTRNSFYGGHPSAPAAATLFVASVYSTYHPHSAFRFALYGIAVAATGTTAYLRYKGGYHFPTDLAIGVALGSTYGLLIPHLHRCKNGSSLSFAPLTGGIKGLDMVYTF